MPTSDTPTSAGGGRAAGNGKIFVSYSHDDAPRARPVADALAARGYPIWIDHHQLVPGDGLFNMINEGLKASRIFLALAGRSYFDRGRFTGDEYAAAFSIARTAPDWRIIVVKLDGDIMMPPLVANMLTLAYEDADQTAEAIAVAIQKFERSDGAVYGRAPTEPATNAVPIDIGELRDVDVRMLTRAILDERVGLLRTGRSVFRVEVRLSQQRILHCEIVRGLLKDEGVVFELKHEMDRIDMATRYVSHTKRELVQGLLGKFEVPMLVLLEEKQAELEAAHRLLRSQVTALVDRAELRHAP